MEASILPGFQEPLLLGLLLLILLTFFLRRFYSVYLGPLSKFPGPKLAAATLWYECYYDVIKRGRYTFKIKEMHEKYGLFVILIMLCIALSLTHFQVQSFASAPLNCTSMSQIIMRSFTLNINLETNPHFTYLLPPSLGQLLELKTINYTDNDVPPWTRSSPSNKYTACSPCSLIWSKNFAVASMSFRNRGSPCLCDQFTCVLLPI